VVLLVSSLALCAQAERIPIHTDSAALEQAFIDTTVALVRGDASATRSGFDRMEKLCRRASQDEPHAYPKQVTTLDAALHLTLDRARELSGAGDVEGASQQMCWIQAVCRDCHTAARKAGITVGAGG
jgi:hypothetical protein